MQESETVVVAELVFCNEPKTNGTSLLGFVEETRVMLTSGMAYKNMSSLQCSINAKS